MWLTGAPLHNPKPGSYNTVGLDQVVAQHTKQYCRQPSLVLSIDAGTGYPVPHGHDFLQPGRPADPGGEQSAPHLRPPVPRRPQSLQSRARSMLQRRIKLVDAVVGERPVARPETGPDRPRADGPVHDFAERGRIAPGRLRERWIDIPLKKQDYSHLNLDATNEGDPAEYYRNMFDLIALAFDADITRSVTFMLNREDGMGISDTFPLKLGLSKTHHNLSHATDKEGQTGISRSTTCS